MNPSETPTKNPALVAQSGYIDMLTSCEDLAELSAVRTEYTVDPILNDVQKGVLKSRYEIEAMRIANKFATKAPATAPMQQSNVERVAKSHEQDDAKQFATAQTADEVFDGSTPTTVHTVPQVTAPVAQEIPTAPIEIITTNSTTNENNSTNKVTEVTTNANNIVPSNNISTPTKTSNTPDGNTTIPNPINIESTGVVEQVEGSNNPKRTRVSKKPEGNSQGVVNGTNNGRSYRIVQRINDRLNGKDYTNNDWTVEVTAPTIEEAVEDITRLITIGKNLYTDTMKGVIDQAYKKGFVEGEEHGKANAPKPAPVQSSVTQAPVKVAYNTNEERMKIMLTQIMNSIPEAKKFMEHFADLNPKIQTNSIV